MDDHSERVPLVLSHFFRESWPGLSRASTPCLLSRRKEDVDARDKRGHDGGEVKRSLRNALS